MDEGSIWLSVLFGPIGMGYAVYGKKQSRWVFLACWVLLMVLPSVIGGSVEGWAACLAAAGLPFLASRLWGL